MKFKILLHYLFIFSVSSCGQNINSENKKMKVEIEKYTNHLIKESSPYLLQHAHNPVNWYPWGKEALDKAKKENKLILVSIGYSACHWCHVMEHESFENEMVAKIMNENFISIKIDREERPDIDQIYMKAVELISGRGGWPLNCIALPDGRPIYGGTYFPTDNWLKMISQVAKFVRENPEKAENQALELTNGIKNSELIILNEDKSVFSHLDLDRTFTYFEKNIDIVNGGSKGSPKFPIPVRYEFLLHYYYISKEIAALDAVNLTLTKMANGGIYDQIGGGFSRYSTDSYWKVPHFEKMTYDNAQLVSLYSSAYQKTKNPLFKTIIEETLEFVSRELTSKQGGFYSSLDADSEGQEGKFYIWKENRLRELLGQDADLIIDYYNVEKSGNWEHESNILLKNESDESFAKRNQLSYDDLIQKVILTKKILLNKRSQRIRPGLDDKILTSWNGLMLKGYLDAYIALGNKDYLKAALKNAEFICDELKLEDNRLFRNFKNNKATINGFLDDYAFTIQAFISLYQATFDQQWLNKAEALLKYSLSHFFDKSTGMFYYTSDIDISLIARKMEISDNVIPSSNSEMAKNLFLMGRYLYNDNYIKMSKTMLNNVKESTIKGSSYFSNWGILMSWLSSETYDVSIVGKDCQLLRKQLNQYYLPNVFISGGLEEGDMLILEGKLLPNETTIYVCQNNTCKLPVNSVDKALKQLAP